MLFRVVLAALLSTCMLTFLAAPGLGQGSPLVGLWRAEKRFDYGGGIVQTLGLSADGRYVWVQDAGGDKTLSMGTYQVQSNQILFQEHYHKPEGGPFSLGGPKGNPWAAGAALQGTDLLLRGDLFACLDAGDGTAHFMKQPGSEKEVGDSLRTSDEQERRSNEEWRARIAFGKGGAGAFTADPSVPKDPNPGRVFGGATVFARPQLYSYVNVNSQHMVVGDTEGGRDAVRFFFMPNGRLFAKWVLYPVEGPRPGEAPRQATVRVTTSWGRYNIVSGDNLQIESDKAEKLALKLVDGRRNLTGMTTVLTQADWLLEILQGRAK